MSETKVTGTMALLYLLPFLKLLVENKYSALMPKFEIEYFLLNGLTSLMKFLLGELLKQLSEWK